MAAFVYQTIGSSWNM